MNYSICRFTLNMHSHRSQASVSAFRGDTAIRLIITLTDGGNTYAIEEGCVAILSGTKADGEKLWDRCVIIGNTIQYDFNEQTASCEGIVNCEVTLYGKDGEVVTAPKFIIVVEKKEFDTYALESESHSSAIEAILQKAKDSGYFDGYTPVRGTDYWTEEDKAEIKSEVDGNFKKGVGSGSAVQKNGGVTGSNGVSVVADAKATGKSAIALNARTEANGDSSGAGGYSAKAHTKADYAFNSGTAGLTEAEFEKLYPDGYNLNGTVLDYASYKARVVSGAFACNNGKATGAYSFSAGSQTSDRGSQAKNSVTFGNYCVCRYGYFDSDSGPLFGEADNSFAGGDTVAVHGPNSFGYGKDLILPKRYDENGKLIPLIVFGRHNNYYHPGYTTIFEVGNGTSNDVGGLHNVFEVLTDGRVKGFGAPVDDNDFVRLGDVKALITSMLKEV